MNAKQVKQLKVGTEVAIARSASKYERSVRAAILEHAYTASVPKIGSYGRRLGDQTVTAVLVQLLGEDGEPVDFVSDSHRRNWDWDAYKAYPGGRILLKSNAQIRETWEEYVERNRAAAAARRATEEARERRQEREEALEQALEALGFEVRMLGVHGGVTLSATEANLETARALAKVTA